MRPEANCPSPPGRFSPVVDRNRCEGKGPCVAACPYDVLRMDRLDAVQRRELSLLGRLKAMAHGNRQAFVVAPEACRACGECVRVCPERAIRLVPA